MIDPTKSAGLLAHITQHHRALDLPIPDGMTDALATLEDVRARAATLAGTHADELAAATVDALTAGRDPFTDKTVTRMLLAQAAATVNLPRLVAEHITRARAEVLAEHLPALRAAWADVVTQADAVLVELREAYPSVDPTDPAGVARMRPDDMPLWGRAAEAARRVLAVESMAKLAASAEGRTIDRRHVPLLVADLAPGDLDTLSRDVMGGATGVHVIRAGHRLTLADPTELAARVARTIEHRAAEHTRAQKAAQNAWGESLQTTRVR